MERTSASVLDTDATSPGPDGADGLRDRLEALRDEQRQVCHDIGAAKRRGESADDFIEQNRLISQQIDALVEQEHAAQEAEDDKTAVAGPLTVSVESSVAAFRDIRDEWDELLLRSDCDSPFLTWEWLYTWWEVYGQDKELYLVLVRSADGRLVGAAPFMIGYRDFRQPKRLHRRTLAFLGTGECLGPNYLKFIAAPGREAEVVRAVLDRMAEDAERWDVALLRHVPCEQGESALLCELAAHEKLDFWAGPGQPCVWGRLPSSFQEYLSTVPSARRRKRLRRADRPLQRACLRVTHTICGRSDEVQAHTRKVLDLHLSRFGSKGDWSAWESTESQTVVIRGAGRLCERGWARVDTLLFDGRVAAGAVGLLFKGTYFSFLSGFAQQAARFSPRHELLRRLIQDLIKDGVTRFDFLGGAYDYKKEYLPQRRHVTTLVILHGAEWHMPRLAQPRLRQRLSRFVKRVAKRTLPRRPPGWPRRGGRRASE